MLSQLDSLQRLVGRSRDPSDSSGGPVPAGALSIAVANAGGGVGKSLVSAGLAVQLSRLGYKVLLLDGETRPGNRGIPAGWEPRFTLAHALDGSISVGECAHRVAEGLDVVSCGEGLDTGLARGPALRSLTGEWSALEADYDFPVVDTGVGMNALNRSLMQSADGVILVLNPDPASLFEAYATLKYGPKDGNPCPVHCLMNGYGSPDADATAGTRLLLDTLENLARHFLGRELEYLGALPYSTRLARSGLDGNVYLGALSNSEFGSGLGAMLENPALQNSLMEAAAKRGGSFFLQRFDYWVHNNPERT